MISTGRNLYHRLRRAGVTLTANGAGLEFDSPVGSLTAELRDLMRAHKAELIAIVNGEYLPAALALVMSEPCEDRRVELAEYFDECAAICEDAGLSAGEAQRQGYIQLARLVETQDRGAVAVEVAA